VSVSDGSPELGRRLLSLAGDSGAGMTKGGDSSLAGDSGLGVKTDRYRRVVVKLYALPYFFGFRIGADSVRIQIWNRSLSVMNTDRIWRDYSSVVDKHFVGSLVDNKVKLACNFFYIQEYIFI
jgi:hypothetical protein